MAPSALQSGEFELALSPAQLDDIVTNKTRFVDLNPFDAYDGLSPANKHALMHLARAADILDNVFLKQDHPDNIRAKQVLQAEAARGDKTAADALTVFMTQNGVIGSDMYSAKTAPLQLFKYKAEPLSGGASYPADLTKDELIKYVLAHPEQAAAIFSNNTIVERAGDRLVARPYSVAFRDEMEAAARALLAAARETDHNGLATYLRWQAQALVNDSDPVAVFNAEKAWINLHNSPLEFTIARESYEDLFSKEAAADPEVAAMLAANGLIANGKDCIGVRVGIINRESDKLIAIYKDNLAPFSAHLPFAEEYRRSGEVSRPLMFADVDLVALAGDYAAFRGGLTIAQNLPNDDKLSVKLGVGGRLVFHRQHRSGDDPAVQAQFLDAIVDPAQRGWYSKDADFLFTLGHEGGHSIGPAVTRDKRPKNGALGQWGAIIEEDKCDIASIVMTDFLASGGKLSAQTANEIYLTWIAGELPARQPAANEAHRMRSVMQLNYFREHGAVSFEKDGKLSLVAGRFPAVAREMLAEAIGLQLEGNPAKAQSFVEKYAAWNDALQYAVDTKMALKPRQYRLLRQPIRNMLLGRN
jgi:hypothetical protein